MTLQLTGKSEPRGLYQDFSGRPMDIMPVLIEQGYDPASVDLIFDRRLNAPAEVIPAWRDYFFWTGDSASTDETGGAVLTLDSQPLRIEKEDEVELSQGALQLTRDQFENLKTDYNSVTMSPEEVKDAQGRGVMKKGSLWLPVNESVGKALGHYLRGKSFEDKSFQTYAQMVSDVSRGSKEVLQQYFDTSRPSQPHLRSLVVYGTGGNSDVIGCNDLILRYNNGFLIGVAQKKE